MAVHRDPRTACFYARRALELAVAWAYKHDPSLRMPYDDRISALIHEPSFKLAASRVRVPIHEEVDDVRVVVKGIGVDAIFFG